MPKPEIQFIDLADVDLAGWLHIATDGLEQPAVDRITSEIQNHYTDAVTAHLESGQTLPAAQATALAEFGDPHAAAKRFKRSHLTIEEANELARIERCASGNITSANVVRFFWLPFIACALGSAFTRPPMRQTWYVTGAIIVVDRSILHLSNRQIADSGDPRRRLIAFKLIIRLTAVIGLPLFLYLTDPPDLWLFFIPLAIVGSGSIRIFRLWLKLYRIARSQSPFPPTPTGI